MTSKNMDLEYFRMIVEGGSITNASKRLIVVPQTLSKYLKNLETEYGCQLIDRKSFTLTESGKRVYIAACDIHDIHIKLREELDSVNKRCGISTGVRIGISKNYVNVIMNEYISALSEHGNTDRILMETDMEENLNERLNTEELDLVIGFQRQKTEEIIFVPLQKTEYFLYVSGLLPEIARRGNGKRHTLEFINDITVFLPGEETCFRRCVDEFVKKNDIHWNSVRNCDNLELAMRMAEQKMGCCIVNSLDFCSDAKEKKGMVKIPMIGLSAYGVLGVFCKKSRAQESDLQSVVYRLKQKKE